MSTREFEGRTILVTGGTSGLGLSVAIALAREGGRVGIVATSAEKIATTIETLKDAYPQCVIAGKAANVADETAVKNAVDELAAELGGFDHAVNSAGISGRLGLAIEDIGADEFLQVLQVNVLGSFLVAKAVLPYLKRADKASFVLIGSDSGFVAAPGMLAYNASKGAIVQLTRALSVELHEPFGIRVNSVCPSIMDTPMARNGLGLSSFEGADYPVSSPDEIANLVLMLLSPRAIAVSGVSMLADFGYAAKSSFPA